MKRSTLPPFEAGEVIRRLPRAMVMMGVPTFHIHISQATAIFGVAGADCQIHAIGRLQRGSALGGGTMVQFPRIRMSSAECRLNR
jgi:hypothetical protein